MGVLDDICRENEQKIKEERLSRLAQNHSIEDFIIAQVIGELERLVRNGEYKYCDWDVSKEAAHHSIEAHLGRVIFSNGQEEYRLLFNDEYYLWQEEHPNLISNSEIINITHHPFDRLDDVYLKENLPTKIKTAFGKGVFCTEVDIHQAYRVDKKIFSRFKNVVHLGKYTLMIKFKFRF